MHAQEGIGTSSDLTPDKTEVHQEEKEKMSQITTIAAALALATAAYAQPTQLTLDNTTSSIAVNATLSTAIGSDSDSDTSPLSGTITIELDDYGIPTAITLHDFIMTTDDSLDFVFDFGFFGSIDVNVPEVEASYATPGTPTGPVGVALDNSFYFPTVMTNLAGTGTANGSILGIGTINETFDLAASNPNESDLAGTVVTTATDVIFSGTIAFAGSSEVATGVTLSMEGTIVINATGEIPSTCIADWNSDGLLDFFDVLGFLDDFSAGNPAADLNNDGNFDFFDVQAFLQSFSAGCP